MKAKILVVDDEPAIVHALKTLLSREGYDVVDCDNSESALNLLQEQKFNLLISDIYMSPIDGLELLSKALEMNPKLAVIMITAFGSVDSAVQAMQHGAFDYITKPFKFDNLIQTVQRALAYEQAQANGESDPGTVQIRYNHKLLAGDSQVMRNLYQTIDGIAKTEQSILLLGEPGVGKSRIAQVIHNLSRHYEYPLIEIDCSADRDAVKRQLVTEGGFEQARNGSLLLDHIDQLDERLQQQLLTILTRMQNLPDEEQLNIRFLLTAAVDLQDLVQKNKFLDDLYYRLAADPIDVPPLRRRIDDLPILIHHFLKEITGSNRSEYGVSLPVLRTMEDYSWSGNLSELRDALAHAVEQTRGSLICLPDLPTPLQEHAAVREGKLDDEASEYRWRNLRAFLKEKERQYLDQVMEMTNGDRQRAADVLGIELKEFNEKYGA